MAIYGDPRCPYCGGGVGSVGRSHQRPPAKCPVCRGVGTMPTSFYKPGYTAPSSSSEAATELCHSCGGRGIV